MGIYIFRSLHAPYIKIGHYRGQNAYCRIAHRGFYSCVCPNEIKNRVSMEDLELIAWFPSLDKKIERLIKQKWKNDRIYKKSEWFPENKLQEILSYFLTTLQQINVAHQCDPFSAMTSRRCI